MPERFDYKDEGELFQLGQRVNNFCELTPETFNPEVHVAEAREIIRAIAPRMKSSSFLRIFHKSTQGKEGVIKGATEHGEVSISTGGSVPKETHFTPTYTYRIGNYIVKGHSTLFGSDWISFEHFWGREEGSRVNENPPSRIELWYRRKTSEPTDVSRVDYETKTFRIGRRSLQVGNGKRTLLWKASRKTR